MAFKGFKIVDHMHYKAGYVSEHLNRKQKHKP